MSSFVTVDRSFAQIGSGDMAKQGNIILSSGRFEKEMSRFPSLELQRLALRETEPGE